MEGLTRKVKVIDYVQVINQISKPLWHHKLIKCIASTGIVLEAFRNMKYCSFKRVRCYSSLASLDFYRYVYMLFRHRDKLCLFFFNS